MNIHDWDPWPFLWIVPVLCWIVVLTVALLARRLFRGRAGGKRKGPPPKGSGPFA
ncbi:hypothetical protein [Nocardia suismassiliense]|uniref:hypothetical protein n=1 Tax=Nocardia suismassiliense TaxID=2077092 RepID=UPI00131F0808|nr:hypothetical protein [Nocardia suismassiliense]